MGPSVVRRRPPRNTAGRRLPWRLTVAAERGLERVPRGAVLGVARGAVLLQLLRAREQRAVGRARQRTARRDAPDADRRKLAAGLAWFIRGQADKVTLEFNHITPGTPGNPAAIAPTAGTGGLGPAFSTDAIWVQAQAAF